MRMMTAEEYADAERDALGIIRAVLHRDWQAAKVFEAETVLQPLVTALLNLLFDELADHDIDPELWLQRKQAELVARIAEGS